MMVDFHDLITRMANELDEYRRLLLDDCTVTHRLSNEARAALADEPAVPEGREPASVTGQPSDGEVAELTAWLRMQGEAQKPGPKSLLSTKTKKEMHANGSRLIRAAELLERQAPVAVRERP